MDNYLINQNNSSYDSDTDSDDCLEIKAKNQSKAKMVNEGKGNGNGKAKDKENEGQDKEVKKGNKESKKLKVALVPHGATMTAQKSTRTFGSSRPHNSSATEAHRRSTVNGVSPTSTLDMAEDWILPDELTKAKCVTNEEVRASIATMRQNLNGNDIHSRMSFDAAAAKIAASCPASGPMPIPGVDQSYLNYIFGYKPRGDRSLRSPPVTETVDTTYIYGTSAGSIGSKATEVTSVTVDTDDITDTSMATSASLTIEVTRSDPIPIPPPNSERVYEPYIKEGIYNWYDHQESVEPVPTKRPRATTIPLPRIGSVGEL